MIGRGSMDTILTKTPKDVFWIIWCPCFLYQHWLTNLSRVTHIASFVLRCGDCKVTWVKSFSYSSNQSVSPGALWMRDIFLLEETTPIRIKVCNHLNVGTEGYK